MLLKVRATGYILWWCEEGRCRERGEGRCRERGEGRCRERVRGGVGRGGEGRCRERG